MICSDDVRRHDSDSDSVDPFRIRRTASRSLSAVRRSPSSVQPLLQDNPRGFLIIEAGNPTHASLFQVRDSHLCRKHLILIDGLDRKTFLDRLSESFRFIDRFPTVTMRSSVRIATHSVADGNTDHDRSDAILRKQPAESRKQLSVVSKRQKRKRDTGFRLGERDADIRRAPIYAEIIIPHTQQMVKWQTAKKILVRIPKKANGDGV